MKIRFLAGRTLAEAGDISSAQTVAASFASETQAEPQAHGKIIDGLIILKRGDAQQAINVLTEANRLLDTWIGHFDLGRAYLEAGQFIQADSEFDRSLKRRGEALSLFLDEEPTYGYFPAVYYYQGRVREGAEQRRVCRRVPRVSRYSRQVERRPTPARRPQARQPIDAAASAAWRYFSA